MVMLYAFACLARFATDFWQNTRRSNGGEWYDFVYFQQEGKTNILRLSSDKDTSSPFVSLLNDLLRIDSFFVLENVSCTPALAWQLSHHSVIPLSVAKSSASTAAACSWFIRSSYLLLKQTLVLHGFYQTPSERCFCGRVCVS